MLPAVKPQEVSWSSLFIRVESRLPSEDDGGLRESSVVPLGCALPSELSPRYSYVPWRRRISFGPCWSIRRPPSLRPPPDGSRGAQEGDPATPRGQGARP